MKPRLFFFHSNGFPARTYGHFLKTLETWNPEAINILGADLSSLGGTMDPMVEEVIMMTSSTIGSMVPPSEDKSAPRILMASGFQVSRVLRKCP